MELLHFCYAIKSFTYKSVMESKCLDNFKTEYYFPLVECPHRDTAELMIITTHHSDHWNPYCSIYRHLRDIFIINKISSLLSFNGARGCQNEFIRQISPILHVSMRHNCNALRQPHSRFETFL